MIIAISGKKTVGKDTVGNIIQYLIWKDKLDREEFYISKNYDYKYFTEVASSQDILSGWKIKKFADKLKDIVCILLGCTREQLEDQEFKSTELGEEWWYIKYWYPHNPHHKKVFTLIPYKEFDSRIFDGDDACMWETVKTTPRLLLQLLGTDCGRQIIHPNIWVNALMSEYKAHNHNEEMKGMSPSYSLFPDWIITDMRFPNELKAVKDRGGITIRVNRDIYLSPLKDGTFLPGKILRLDEHESETALDYYQDFDYIIDNNGTIEELIQKVKEVLIKEKII